MPPAPRVITHVTCLRRSDGAWTRSHEFEPGDHAVFRLRFRWVPVSYVDNRGWDRPTAHVVIRREIYPFPESCLPSPGQEGVTVVTGPMTRKLLPDGTARFSAELVIGDGPRWVGHHLVMFYVTNGQGMRGIYLPKGLEVGSRSRTW